MIAGLLYQVYTAHPSALLAFGGALGASAGFLVGARLEARWWRARLVSA